MTKTEHSPRIQALRCQLAEFLNTKATDGSCTLEQVTIAVAQILADITVSSPGDITDNISWVLRNYTLAVNQMSSEIDCRTELVEMPRGAPN